MLKFPRKTVYLISPDPQKIEGLELAWPQLKIFVNKLTPYLRKAEKRGADITNLKLPKVKKTSELLEHMLNKKLLKRGHRVLVFKNLPKIEKLAERHHFEVLMPEARFINLLEDKINFVDFCHKHALPLLPTKISELQQVIFTEPIVIQTRRGHAGESTFFIRSARELQELKKKAGAWVVKITPLKKLPTFSLNFCITREGFFSTQPFYQITGDPELNPLPGGTGGIDFGLAQKMLSLGTFERIFALVDMIGNALEKVDYRGIVGVDFLVDDARNRVHLIELNPRLLSNLGFVTQKQFAKGEIPLLTIHLLELLDADLREYDLQRISGVTRGRFELPHPDAKLVF